MKTKHLLLPLLALAAGFLSGCSDSARKADLPVGQLFEPAEKDAAWLAQVRPAYPLKVCVVSGEDLGSMGDTLERIYRRAGQPDRLVRFCCDGCPDDFTKDPAKFLAQLDHPAAGVTATPTKHNH